MAQIDRHLQFLGGHEGLLREGPRPIADCTPELRRGLVRKCSPSRRVQVTDACAEILTDGIRRLSRDLLPEFQARGIRLEGRNPKALVATYLSQDERFVSDQRLGGWALRQAPLVAFAESPLSKPAGRAAITKAPNFG